MIVLTLLKKAMHKDISDRSQPIKPTNVITTKDKNSFKFTHAEYAEKIKSLVSGKAKGTSPNLEPTAEEKAAINKYDRMLKAEKRGEATKPLPAKENQLLISYSKKQNSGSRSKPAKKLIINTQKKTLLSEVEVKTENPPSEKTRIPKTKDPLLNIFIHIKKDQNVGEKKSFLNKLFNLAKSAKKVTQRKNTPKKETIKKNRLSI